MVGVNHHPFIRSVAHPSIYLSTLPNYSLFCYKNALKQQQHTWCNHERKVERHREIAFIFDGARKYFINFLQKQESHM
jgi:hypothetical protein